MSDRVPLDTLRDAVQDWVNATHTADGPCLLSEAVVLYEVITYDSDGTTGRALSYAIPTDNFSLSGALGLVEAGRHYLRRDILNSEDD